MGADTFVGAYLPLPLVETLALLALTRGVSKTEILCQLLQKTRTELTNSISIPTIAKNAMWHYIDDQTLSKKQRKYKNWHAFIVACRNELRTKKGVSSEVIMQIIDALIHMNKRRNALNAANVT